MKTELRRIWARIDLQKYLLRWENTNLVEIPHSFFDFEQRSIDVGCGLGAYIIRESAIRPKMAFLGVDKSSHRASMIENRIDQTRHKNLFFAHTNIVPFLCQFPDQSLDEITIFYPNPWWPRKHRKKRWSYHPLLTKLASVLKPNGRILVCSNECFYLAEWLEAMNHHPSFSNYQISYVGPARFEQPRSHFEKQFVSRDMILGEIECVRRDLT